MIKFNKSLLLKFFLVTLLIFPLASSAIQFNDGPTGATPTLQNVINRVVDVVWWVFIAIVVILFITIAVLFLNSEGEPAKLETARRALIWGAAGVLVGILAFSIIGIVNNTFFAVEQSDPCNGMCGPGQTCEPSSGTCI